VVGSQLLLALHQKKCMVSKLNLCSLSSEIDRQNRNKVAV
jgi:hypothetical protein